MNINSSIITKTYKPIPQILLYNFIQNERTHKILRYLKKQKFFVRIVQTPEFLHPLGYLFEMPDFDPCSQFNMGKNFRDEMMVIKDFSTEQIDAFLQFFHDNNLESVALKAVLTPITAHWNSLKLHEELKKEHDAMQ